MFHLPKEDLERLGAVITAPEIYQQPGLWKETYQLYHDKLEAITAFLDAIKVKHDFVQVIFTGAGTSDFVGQSIANHLNRVNDTKHIRFVTVGTVEIVSRPYDYLQADIPTVLVSFARSGNSPESLAAVEIAKQLVDTLYQVTITCAPEGKLAQAAADDAANLLLLQPALSNDKGFAMTGSYTCMALTALLVFSPEAVEVKAGWVDTIARLGQDVLDREDDVQDLVNLDFERVIYLGAGGFYGLAHEAQLKILELTAGKIATMYESPLGFRHGPKSLINEKTIVLLFASNDAYTRQYDVDLVNEVYGDQIAARMVVLSTDKLATEAPNFVLAEGGAELPDVFLTFPYILFGQTFAIMTAIKCKNLPDTPSPTGTVNRVVQGVTIHPL
ncbi:SIS domain-containing protein [Streptococcus acidominimus]|uniref:SIS domain-containing protein n=1 Tax=Streptococcus acidominimus TaxID=1326 RepID=A0A4Y9FPR8_STRAI|nr:SIS domain-containing protein [Streptococcus acidominimus]MBF0819143.1 SIS domain-containing protein [Streptococcus acidominimus]MBF0838686.1 SIS domain-containing protein [Streptococcus acidominimus]MBF0846820.1 SIS domain-containing protein [Streptococcus danieliae]TFU30299.1 SIS domain-containing protein [Streptococcus acidominimus]